MNIERVLFQLQVACVSSSLLVLFLASAMVGAHA